MPSSSLEKPDVPDQTIHTPKAHADTPYLGALNEFLALVSVVCYETKDGARAAGLGHVGFVLWMGGETWVGCLLR